MDMKIFGIGQLNRAVVNKPIGAWRIAPICAIVATLFSFMLGIPLPGQAEDYMFVLEKFRIEKTRSTHEDTDYVNIAGKVATHPVTSQSKRIGDVNDGDHSVNLKYGPFTLNDQEHAVISYQIVNSGHKRQSDIEAALDKGASMLTVKLAGTAAAGPWGLISAQAVDWLKDILDINCDGIVAADQIEITGAQLKEWTANGPHIEDRFYRGTDSAIGCGGNSKYRVHWSIVRTTSTGGFNRPHSGYFLQSKFGKQGNFELIVPLAPGGLGHYWRNNDAPDHPWTGPVEFGKELGKVEAVSLIQNNFGDGNLEAVVRVGDRMASLWTPPGGTWSEPFFFATGVSGTPALIQSSFGKQGNFELIVPLASGGLGHYWRNNDAPDHPWTGPVEFGKELGKVEAVSLIQSNFGDGNLEAVVRVGDRMASLWTPPGGKWSEPFFLPRQ
jgi:hypothetical protein